MAKLRVDAIVSELELRGARFVDGSDPSSASRPSDSKNVGIGEIRGNLIRNLAALDMVETLPWDEWGRIGVSYARQTGPDFDELMDEVARSCATDDEQEVATIYARHELRVPSTLS